MNTQPKNVTVINDDPQILKGLILLLEDMSLNVLAASSPDILERYNHHATCPDLLIFPLLFDNDESSIDLVKNLRTHFNKNIPAIIISTNNNFNSDRGNDPGITLLSDQVKPNVLRQQVKMLLEQSPACIERSKTGD